MNEVITSVPGRRVPMFSSVMAAPLFVAVHMALTLSPVFSAQIVSTIFWTPDTSMAAAMRTRDEIARMVLVLILEGKW